MPLPKEITIREVGPREGFQSIKTPIATDKKLELVRLLGETGVGEIEITSFVRPDKVPQMADADEVVKKYERKPGVRYTALYLNQRGFERAEDSKRLDNRAWLMTATSDTFLRKNNNTSHGEAVTNAAEWLAAFNSRGKRLFGLMVSTAFGCSDEGTGVSARIPEVVRDMVRACAERGSSFEEICLADTMGWGTPERVRRAVGELKAQFPAVSISLHLHDTRGSGLANAYAGLLEGVTVFESSVGGMGGCPFAAGAAGNIVTEDLVYMTEEAGIQTGISLPKYIDAARFAEEVVGYRLPSKLLRAWRN